MLYFGVMERKLVLIEEDQLEQMRKIKEKTESWTESKEGAVWSPGS
jgi:hypothetical protein